MKKETKSTLSIILIALVVFIIVCTSIVTVIKSAINDNKGNVLIGDLVIEGKSWHNTFETAIVQFQFQEKTYNVSIKTNSTIDVIELPIDFAKKVKINGGTLEITVPYKAKKGVNAPPTEIPIEKLENPRNTLYAKRLCEITIQ